MRSVPALCLRVLATLLAAGVIAAFVASTCWSAKIDIRRFFGRIQASVAHGIFHFEWQRHTKFINYPVEWTLQRTTPGLFESHGDNLRYEYSSFNGGFKGYANFSLPLIAPAAVMVILTAWTWAEASQRRRRGHCPRCSYNLFGASALRCPECGLAVSAGLIAQAKPEEPPNRLRHFVHTAVVWSGALIATTTVATVAWTIHDRIELQRILKTPEGAISVAKAFLNEKGHDAGLVPATAVAVSGGWDVSWGDPSAPLPYSLHIDANGKITDSGTKRFFARISSSTGNGVSTAALPGVSSPRFIEGATLSATEQTQLILAAKAYCAKRGINIDGLTPVVFLDGSNKTVALANVAVPWRSRIIAFNEDGELLETTDRDLSRYIATGALERGVALLANVDPEPALP